MVISGVRPAEDSIHRLRRPRIQAMSASSHTRCARTAARRHPDKPYALEVGGMLIGCASLPRLAGLANLPSEAADRAGGDLSRRVDDEEAGAAVGAAVGLGRGVAAAAHSAHRHGSTGDRSGRGTGHHVLGFLCVLSGSRMPTHAIPALVAATRPCSRSGTARCREPERCWLISWPGASGER